MELTQQVCKDDPNAPAPIVVSPGHLKFGPQDEFFRELKQRVDRFARLSGRPQRDCPQMYVKSAIILAWLAASYGFLVFGPPTWWSAPLLALSLGLAMAAVGFSIQHDANHHAYSNRPWLNKLMSRTLDLVGASSYIWSRKHNTIHHSYSNITGHDDDINLGFIGRLSPHQKRLFFHRIQHFYLWVLYGFLPVKWQIYDDFHNLVTGRIGAHRFVRPRGLELAIMLVGKAVFFTLALVIPLLLHPFWAVLVFYLAVCFVLGVLLSVVFQLAHCVEEADFPMPDRETGRMKNAWAVHQIETTVDFARNNRLVCWFCGGLNFQVEHHLFPQICHIHYPALSPLLEQTCKEFGVRYQAHRGVWPAIVSHYRWLRRMGSAEPAAMPALA